MGLLDSLFQQTAIRESILPPAAKNEIIQGRLPRLNTGNIFMKQGEFCCYIDKAILNIEKKEKYYNYVGSSRKGLFGDYRVNVGTRRPHEYDVTEQQKGILYITNRRIIFQAPQNGFDKSHSSLTSIAPYSNAVILQYGNKSYTLIVSDGNLVKAVLRQII